MFHKRPLTWLFVIATVCLDLVSIAANHEQPMMLVTGFFLGQSLVLGCLLALGKEHRLARGAIFVVGQILLALMVCLGFPNNTMDNWGYVLAALSLNGFAAFLGSYLGRIVISWRQKSDTRDLASRIRFPVIELFGWTIVVAIASAVMREADYSLLLSATHRYVALVLSAIIAGVIAARMDWPKSLAAVSLLSMASFFAIFFLIAFLQIPERELVISLLIAVAYTILWAVVRRLDALSFARKAQQT